VTYHPEVPPERAPDPSFASLSGVTRRGFLLRSAGLGAALSLGGLLAGGGCSGYDELLAGETPRSLEPREYAVLRAVAARMVPGGPSHPGADALGVAARVDRELTFHGPLLCADVRDALRLVEWWPLPTRFARFTRLPAPLQDAELGALATSSLAFRRSAFNGLKVLIMFFHYTQDAAWAGTGYDGPWVPRRPPAALA
jgi:hypothetical protein